MKAIVKLKIERFEEHQEEYFVATNDEIQGSRFLIKLSKRNLNDF